MRGERGRLVFRQKQLLSNGLLCEGVIWGVPKTERYPDGIRYRLALVDPEMRKIFVLFDNHFPKGHHRHLADGTQVPYEFRSASELIKDYFQAIMEEKERYEDQKNSY